MKHIFITWVQINAEHQECHSFSLHDLHGELCISVLVTENSKGNILFNILASTRRQIRPRIPRT